MLLLALVAGLAAPALAAPEGPPAHFRGDDVVRARLVLDSRTLSAGGSTEAAVELIPNAGWHLYGPEHGDAGAPPEITWMLPPGVHAGPIAYPPSKRVVSRGLTTFEYRGPTVLRVPLSAAAGTQPLRDGVLQANVTWLVCSNVCVPGRATLRTTLDVVPGSTGGFASIAPFLGLAFLGGLILNLMPCVFPVLSFKALRAIEEPSGRRWRSAIAYAVGVTASCAGLGGVLVAARSAGNAVGWGFQLQSPVLVAFLALLLFGLALAMSGFVELTLPIPRPLARVAASAGPFGDGVLVTLIASPCVAPYMGAALAFALSASAPVAIGVFVALGFGLALPHALLMVVPALLHWLPKPGRWMLVARRVLALPLYLSALWLGWVFVQQINPVSHTTAASTAQPGAFTTARLSALRHDRRAVLVDVSAAWCITCKVNERLALDRPAVSRRLRELHVTVLHADWTNQDPRITAYLHALGTAGVPLYVYYPSSGEVDVWPQLLTQALVIDRLDRASHLTAWGRGHDRGR
jgi:thiol:disulfide interchange protein